MLLIPGPHQKSQQQSQPKIPALRIYVGWSGWKKGKALQVATSSSSQLKSQPCIPGEYVGLVFLAGSAVGIFGVAVI